MRLLSKLIILVTIYAPWVGPAATVDLGAPLSKLIEQVRAKSDHDYDFDCSKIISRLKGGDVVVFSDGTRYTLKEDLGNGGSAFIWSIRGRSDTAIRVPLGNSESIEQMPQYREGWKKLVSLSIRPIVQIKDPDNTSDEYQLVSRHDFKFAFIDFHAHLRGEKTYLSRLRNKTIEKAIDALPKFAIETAELSLLGDGIQAGFDGKQWILFDFVHVNNRVHSELVDGKSHAEETIWGWGRDKEHSHEIMTALHNHVLYYREHKCERALTLREALKPTQEPKHRQNILRGPLRW